MKKIGIFDPYLDDLGGGERYMMTIASVLSEKYEVSVFWDERKDLENIEKRFLIDLSKVRLTSNIFSSNFGFINKLKETFTYDGIIFLSDGSIPLLFSKKTFIHIQQPITNKSISIKDKFKLRKISSVFCNSEFTKGYIDNTYKINSSLLYPPVSIRKFEKNKKNIILHVGRFRVLNVRNEDYKKQHVMINVFKEMIDAGFKGWEFVLAVSMPDENDKEFVKMKDSAQGYPIKFLINYPNNKLWEIASSAKIYWHASGYGEDLKKNPHFAEHFGISTVEAMSSGIVPVVISAGGQKEIVKNGENGYLWETLSELKEKTIKLSEDSELFERLSLKASEDANRFDEKNFKDNVLKIINV